MLLAGGGRGFEWPGPRTGICVFRLLTSAPSHRSGPVIAAGKSRHAHTGCHRLITPTTHSPLSLLSNSLDRGVDRRAQNKMLGTRRKKKKDGGVRTSCRLLLFMMLPAFMSVILILPSLVPLAVALIAKHVPSHVCHSPALRFQALQPASLSMVRTESGKES